MFVEALTHLDRLLLDFPHRDGRLEVYIQEVAWQCEEEFGPYVEVKVKSRLKVRRSFVRSKIPWKPASHSFSIRTNNQ